jgi:hypothetical protein
MQQAKNIQYATIAKAYDTNYGTIEITQQGAYVRGIYPTGTIEGIMEGNTLTGTWEDAYSTGRLKFIFSSDLNQFDGLWGTWDNEPTSTWGGVRSRAIISQPQAIAAATSQKTATSGYLTIAGSYDTTYGTMIFSQHYDQVTGTY